MWTDWVRNKAGPGLQPWALLQQAGLLSSQGDPQKEATVGCRYWSEEGPTKCTMIQTSLPQRRLELKGKAAVARRAQELMKLGTATLFRQACGPRYLPHFLGEHQEHIV